MLFSKSVKTFEELERELISDIIDPFLFDPQKALTMHTRTPLRKRVPYLDSTLRNVGKIARPLTYALLVGGVGAMAGCTGDTDDKQNNIPEPVIDDVDHQPTMIDNINDQPNIKLTFTPYTSSEESVHDIRTKGSIADLISCDGRSYAKATHLIIDVIVEDKDVIDSSLHIFTGKIVGDELSFRPGPYSGWHGGLKVGNYITNVTEVKEESTVRVIEWHQGWATTISYWDAKGRNEFYKEEVPFEIHDSDDEVKC